MNPLKFSIGIILTIDIRLLFALCGFSLLTLADSNKAIGQITPDGTIPTKVERSENVSEITGGSQAGNNLFHSFEEFSVPTGQEAFFDNANNIVNIFSRVTGNSISEIDGLIRANGSANLFLLNPNGIIFGENSSLDIGGSFLATTADSFIFQDGTIFDTQNPETSLLTIDIPVGLQIGANAGSIINRSTAASDGETVGLRVNQDRHLTFVGGNITFDGGRLTAPGGEVNLAGLSAPGLVELNENNGLSFFLEASLSDILLDNGAEINVRASNGGNVAINAHNFSLEEQSFVLAGIIEGSGTTASQAGNIDVNAIGTGTVNITGGSFLSNTIRPGAMGKGGDISIVTDSLFLDSKAGIATSTIGQGDAGNIQIKAINSISVNDASVLQADTFGLGNAGDITIKAHNGTVSFQGTGTGISTAVQPGAIGQGGDISINTNKFLITNILPNESEASFSSSSIGALLQARTFGQGDAGNITIQAEDSLTLNGSFGGILSTVETGAIGEGGNINLDTNSLSITDGATIQTLSLGDGSAGNIDLKVTDSIAISGTAPFTLQEDGIEVGGFSSGILSNTEGVGGTGGRININTQYLRLSDGGVISSRSRSNFDGGDIIINAQTLDLIDGGQILTSAFRQGNAGDITFNVSDLLTISGGDPTIGNRFERVAANFGLEQAEVIIDPVNALSGIYANADIESTGDSGNVFINSDQLNITDNARISVSNWGEGNGGSLLVKSNMISLSDGADLLAATFTGERGNITLKTNSLNLSGASKINTDAQSTDGGNIFIDTDTLVALENSDITANAQQGRGGRVTIDARGIFGTQFRDFPTSRSDITASSSLGSQFNGIVEINTTDANPTEGLSKLPTKLISPEPLQSCQAQKNLENSRFINTGRGGLPISPDEVNSNSVWEDLRSVNSNSDRFSRNITDNVSIEAESEKIVEAQGWIVNSKGNVVLTAQPSITASNQNDENNYATCFIFK